jgi:hypothetical protein
MATKKNSRQYPDRPTKIEKTYVEFDEEFEQWGVFGERTGHCYGLYCDDNKAKQLASAN